ncbi:MAG: aconitate hydratase AcnA [Chloroflexi bacterium]|nr:MAG: aconitate hydratase AcnA [Chloroflexota bacterium]
MVAQNYFNAKDTFDTGSGQAVIYRLSALEDAGITTIARLPFSIRVLLEAALRQADGFEITREAVETIARWSPESAASVEIPFKPARVVLQDFTGVPSVVDLAALRGAMARLGGDPRKVNPLVPVDLVVDHSVQVDRFGSVLALSYNAEREFERNRERYEFLKWGQTAFDNFRVVPPATGIVHQVNLEYLAQVVLLGPHNGMEVAYPDSLVGTDSHTTMINGLGVLGWGVGGIEAEAVMLGQPIYMLLPEVVGFKLTGELPDGATATDLVLRVTEMLRKKGVVDKFVEFYGPGLDKLSLPDRATIGNMAPEYGATMGFFPVDDETLRYLIGTGRSEEQVELVERYMKEQQLFRTSETPDPLYSDTLELDMSSLTPSLAGPKRPQDRIELSQLKERWAAILPAPVGPQGFGLSDSEIQTRVEVSCGAPGAQSSFELTHGSVVIAAITSCTNTSNPSVMVGAGLLAKKAVERGLDVKPWVKTSMAPGSKVVTRYLEEAGLTPYLEALNFHTVGYGCTTCIGNSGPLPDHITQAISEGNLVAAAVLSGNRNFEGRINPDVRANFLASPPLVVAFAIAGTVNIDLDNDPLGYDPNGAPVYLRDIWPAQEEIKSAIRRSLKPEMFREQYANVFTGNEQFNQVPVAGGALFQWDPESTYVKEPPFFTDLTLEVPPVQPIVGARCLAIMPDSTTTDHISPAGSIAPNSPAGQYLTERGIPRSEWNSYGSRRGNHEIMMRGTFANIRIKNQMLDGEEGGNTVYIPSMQKMSIYDAAMQYQADKTPLIVLAGREYGTGSSRDWAAKGPQLLGVRAVIAESFERIHRSNLVGMGVLPLQFMPGEGVSKLDLSGFETYDILGLSDEMHPGQEYTVRATDERGLVKEFKVISRIDTPVEVNYYKNGGILHTVLRRLAAS